MATMNTYTANTTTWLRQLDAVVAAIPLSKLVVGLECDEADMGALPLADLQARFDALEQRGMRGVGLWRMPVPDSWWPFLQAFANPVAAAASALRQRVRKECQCFKNHI